MECSIPKSRLVMFLVFSLVISAVSLAGLFVPWEGARTIAILFLVLGGIASLLMARRLWVGGSDLLLNDKGILDRRTGLCVRWSEVRRLSVVLQDAQGNRVQYLAIEVADPDKHLSGLSKLSSKLDEKQGIPPLHVEFGLLWPGLNEVCDYIQRQLGITVHNWQNPATAPGAYVQPRPDPRRRN